MNLEVITRTPNTTTPKPPLLFVHGIVHGAWCWDEHFLPYFAQHGYHTSALSLRNHGRSEKVSNWRWLRIKDYVNDVAQVATKIEAEYGQSPIVIGHSMGGLIVQKYLEKHDAPAAILVASCPAHGVWQTMFRTIINHPMAFLQVNLKLNLKMVANTTQRAHWAFFSASMPQTQVQQYTERFNDESYLVFLDMLLFALPRVKKINTPMLVVAGATDTLFSVEEERRTALTYGAQFHNFDDVAHDMMLEDNWESVAESMLNWLDNVSSKVPADK